MKEKCCDVRPIDVARLLKAMAHPVRLQMIRMMHDREVRLEHLMRVLVLSKGQIYRHIRALEEAGLVGSGRSLKRGFYGLVDQDCSALRELVGAAIEQIDEPSPNVASSRRLRYPDEL